MDLRSALQIADSMVRKLIAKWGMTGMSIEYQIQVEGAILKVKAVGTCDNLDQLKAYVLAMHQAALSAGLTRVLVD